MDILQWIGIALVSILSTARVIRFLIWDTFPPMMWVRVRFYLLTEKNGKEGPWYKLLKCGYCNGPYVATGIVLWGYFTDWQVAWWLANSIAAVSYLAAVFVTFDGEIVED